ncbi:unnamed protein product, partial [Rotaria sp. Silwood2]
MTKPIPDQRLLILFNSQIVKYTTKINGKDAAITSKQSLNCSYSDSYVQKQIYESLIDETNQKN